MKKYMVFAVAALLASCGDSNNDVKEFEKKQANAAKEIAAQQAETASTAVSSEPMPCKWAGLKEGCDITAFGETNPLYVVVGPKGDILVTSANNVREIEHTNFTDYVSKTVEYAGTQGKDISESDVKSASKTYTQTQRGYILTIELDAGKVYILEDGRVMGKLN